jgi:hypothetical protein
MKPRLAPIIQKELQKTLEAKIIAPMRLSSLVTDPTLARKKNGEIKLCVDFKSLNQLYLKDNYMLPTIEHSLQKVTKSGMMSIVKSFLDYN